MHRLVLRRSSDFLSNVSCSIRVFGSVAIGNTFNSFLLTTRVFLIEPTFILFISFMRADFDLHFLQFCENNDLRVLCDILMYDNNGKTRLSEGLSNSDEFRACYPQKMSGMWKNIASELQRYGGNSILNFFRNGQGPAYERIVYDACKHMGVKNIRQHDTAEDMERKLLIFVSKKAIGGFRESEIRSIMVECGVRGYDYSQAGLIAALISLQHINRRLFIIVINAVMKMASQILIGRGVMMVGMGVLSRGLGVLCGPLGWALMCGWTAWDLLGPAYRVTIPAVIQVAYMRAKYQGTGGQVSVPIG